MCFGLGLTKAFASAYSCLLTKGGLANGKSAVISAGAHRLPAAPLAAPIHAIISSYDLIEAREARSFSHSSQKAQEIWLRCSVPAGALPTRLPCRDDAAGAARVIYVCFCPWDVGASTLEPTPSDSAHGFEPPFCSLRLQTPWLSPAQDWRPSSGYFLVIWCY